jgi:GDP-L-fucose synthase
MNYLNRRIQMHRVRTEHYGIYRDYDDEFEQIVKENEIIADYFDKEIVWDTDKPMGDMKRIMDTTRAESYGFKAQTTLKEGIEKTIEWYLEKNK